MRMGRRWGRCFIPILSAIDQLTIKGSTGDVDNKYLPDSHLDRHRGFVITMWGRLGDVNTKR
ncbi:hypothetical protein M758_5G116400 [Ceratodon purpureus]|nr:hypothetical protein M758_5G116400 [Ceratodon purpureus]